MTMLQGSSSSAAVPRFLNSRRGNRDRERSEGKVEVQGKDCSSAFPVALHPYYSRHMGSIDWAAVSVVIGLVTFAAIGFVSTIFWLTKFL